MKIYGYKLSSKFKFIHMDFSDTCEDDEILIINPEETISPACHLYEDFHGNQFVGFEVSLGIPTLEMSKLLVKKSKFIDIICE